MRSKLVAVASVGRVEFFYSDLEPMKMRRLRASQSVLGDKKAIPVIAASVVGGLSLIFLVIAGASHAAKDREPEKKGIAQANPLNSERPAPHRERQRQPQRRENIPPIQKGDGARFAPDVPDGDKTIPHIERPELPPRAAPPQKSGGLAEDEPEPKRDGQIAVDDIVRCKRLFDESEVGDALATAFNAVRCDRATFKLPELRFRHDIDNFWAKIDGFGIHECTKCDGSGIKFESRNYGALQRLAATIACAEVDGRQHAKMENRLDISYAFLRGLIRSGRVGHAVRSELQGRLTRRSEIGDGIVLEATVTKDNVYSVDLNTRAGKIVLIKSRPHTAPNGQAIVMGKIDRMNNGSVTHVYGVVVSAN